MDNFSEEYKKAMAEVHASDELRKNILEMKPQKRTVSPFKATLATVAAAAMIMVVAHDYAFTPDSDGVISETVVSTQMPQAEFSAAETQTEAPKADYVAPKPKATVKPETNVAEAQAVADVEPQVINETEEQAGVPMTARSGGAGGEAQVWEINRYFDYIGANPQNKISAVVPMEYTGESTLEFVVDTEGEPVHDVVTLDYAGADGKLSVTVSKKPMFDTSLSGTINATDNGFIAYKVSGDVYYYIFAQGISQDEITAIVSNF